MSEAPKRPDTQQYSAAEFRKMLEESKGTLEPVAVDEEVGGIRGLIAKGVLFFGGEGLTESELAVKRFQNLLQKTGKDVINGGTNACVSVPLSIIKFMETLKKNVKSSETGVTVVMLYLADEKGQNLGRVLCSFDKSNVLVGWEFRD